MAQSSSWCVTNVELKLTKEQNNSEKSLRHVGSGMFVNSMSAKFSKLPSGVSCIISWKNFFLLMLDSSENQEYQVKSFLDECKVG